MAARVFGGEAKSLGKAARTRARLMDAAIAVFARAGIEAASVNEIAAEADVANGTFYNHFRDKDELVAAVALAMAGDIVRRLDERLAGVESAPERVSFATRRCVELAAARPEWGWVLARAAWSVIDLRRELTRYARADIARGISSGDFTVELGDFVVDAFTAIVVAAMLARLRGEAGEEAGSTAAELQLRMLGVSAKRAKEVAWRTLEPLEAPPSP